MKNIPLSLFLALLFLGTLPRTVLAQEDVQVISIGETIQPEAAPKKKKRGPARLRKGTPVLVEVGQLVSTSLNQVGDKVLIRSAKKVGWGRRGLIPLGSPGRARVEKLQSSKHDSLISLRVESIEDVYGNLHPLEGRLQVVNQDKSAVIFPGATQEATLAQTVSIRYRRKAVDKRKKIVGQVTLDEKVLEINPAKSRAKKRKVKAIIELPGSVSADSLIPTSVKLTEVNGRALPNPVFANAKDARKKDANKNKIEDWTVYFNLYDFGKYLKRGNNRIQIEGQVKGNRRLVTTTFVTMEY